jgi:hypothetical protein
MRLSLNLNRVFVMKALWLALPICLSSYLAAEERHRIVPLEPFIDDVNSVITLTYPDQMDWSFFRTSTYCYSTIRAKHGRLLIGFNQQHDQVHIGFTTDLVTAPPDGTSIPLEVLALRRLSDGSLGEPASPEGEYSAVVQRNSDGRPVYSFFLDGMDTLEVLRSHDTFAVEDRDDHVLAAFSLKGSSKALGRLETCTPR